MSRNQHGDWKYKLQLFKGNHTLYYVASDAEACWGHLEGFGAKSTATVAQGEVKCVRNSIRSQVQGSRTCKLFVCVPCPCEERLGLGAALTNKISQFSSEISISSAPVALPSPGDRATEPTAAPPHTALLLLLPTLRVATR
ncbi:uncharacterized [Tachysurus ichikawai]